ncbi:MAG: tRNA (adenosine(37)-N6)-threonylcarbamoyltransferase complex ATPase subunit type 1 TsaE [Flavobacteriales bacterium]
MPVSTFRAERPDELDDAAAALIDICDKRKTIALFGEMGSGKTTLVSVFCALKGVENTVSSPTFSLINEYTTSSGELIYHMDFYRIKNEQEAIDIGLMEYFGSGNCCLLEWPEKIMNLLPHDFVKVLIRAEGNHRNILIHI